MRDLPEIIDGPLTIKSVELKDGHVIVEVEGATKQLKALARTADPQTSHAAAHAVTPHVQALQLRILRTLAKHPLGLTTHEIASRTGDMEWGSVTPRMLPMFKAGLVIVIGNRIPPGRVRASVIWCLTGKGADAVAQNPPQSA